MTKTSAKAFACCPQCGGFPEFDEDGLPYTCYFCCDTGRVEQSVADAYMQAVTDDREQFRPRVLGVYLRPMASEYDYGDEQEPAPGSRMFTRLVRAQPAARVTPAVDLYADEIPF